MKDEITLKETLIDLVIIILLLLLVYFGSIFILLEPNPILWEQSDRTIFLLSYLIVVILYYLYNTLKNKD